MKNIFITFFCLQILLSSCMTGNRLAHLFLDGGVLSAQTSSIEKDSILNPFMMRLVNDRLFMCNISTPMVTYFDWQTGKCIGHFGSKGVGKGEFINFNSVSVYDSTLVLFDGNKKECYFIPDVLAPTDYKGVKIEEVEDIVPFKVIALEEDLLLVTGIIKDGRFALYNGKGHFLSVFGEYPKEGHGSSENSARNAFAYQSHVAYEPYTKVLAIGNAFGEGVSFYNLENTDKPYLIKEIFTNPPQCKDSSTKNSSSVVFTKENIMGFVDICSYEKYFIGLFCGEKRVRGKEWKGGNNLFIFDLKGNPIRKITLSKSYLQMSVGGKELVLLGTDNEAGNFEVDKINLDIICVK